MAKEKFPIAKASYERWKKQQARTFEINAPAAIINLLQENFDHTQQMAECIILAKQMIQWFKQLNKEDSHPSITWTEFIHQKKQNSAEKIKRHVMESFKD